MNHYTIIRHIKNVRILSFIESIANIFYWFLSLFMVSHAKQRESKKYYISVCAIFKNEARFLKEWLMYYQVIGVDHVYLYNNNSDDNYQEVLQPFIESGYVTLTQWPGAHIQMEAYADCYNRFKAETTWLSFLDMDEFLCPLKEYDIKDFLKRYEGYPGLMIYWQMFGTNGQLDHDWSRLVTEQYTCAWDHLDGTGKVILYTSDKYRPRRIYHHHVVSEYKILGIKVRVPIITEQCRFKLFNQIYLPPKVNTIQINHYFSKSFNLYKEKMAKGSVASNHNEAIRKKMDFFLLHEKHNICENKTIFRFMTLLKLRYYNCDNTFIT